MPSRCPQRSSSAPATASSCAGVVDVELEDVGLGVQALGHALGDAQAAAEAGQDHSAPSSWHGAPRSSDRAVGQHAGDQQLSSLEKHALHNYLFVAGRATGSTLGPVNVEPFG